MPQSKRTPIRPRGQVQVDRRAGSSSVTASGSASAMAPATGKSIIAPVRDNFGEFLETWSPIYKALKDKSISVNIENERAKQSPAVVDPELEVKQRAIAARGVVALQNDLNAEPEQVSEKAAEMVLATRNVESEDVKNFMMDSALKAEQEAVQKLHAKNEEKRQADMAGQADVTLEALIQGEEKGLDPETFVNGYLAAKEAHLLSSRLGEDFDQIAFGRLTSTAIAHANTSYGDRLIRRAEEIAAGTPEGQERVKAAQEKYEALSSKTAEEEEVESARGNEVRVLSEQDQVLRNAINANPKQLIRLRNELLGNEESARAALGDMYDDTLELVTAISEAPRKADGNTRRNKDPKLQEAILDRILNGQEISVREVISSGMSLTAQRKVLQWLSSDPEDPESPLVKELEAYQARKEAVQQSIENTKNSLAPISKAQPTPKSKGGVNLDDLPTVARLDDEQYTADVDNKERLRMALFDPTKLDAHGQFFNVPFYRSISSEAAQQDAADMVLQESLRRQTEALAPVEDYAAEPDPIPLDIIAQHAEQATPGMIFADVPEDDPNSTLDIQQGLHKALSVPNRASMFYRQSADIQATRLPDVLYEEIRPTDMNDDLHAIGRGIRHGVQYDGPEMMGRALRTFGHTFGSDSMIGWGKDLIQNRRSVRQKDPYGYADARWMQDGWTGSLYSGLSSVAASMTAYVPASAASAGAMVTAPKVAGGAAVVGFLGKLGIVGTAGAAAVGGIVAQSTIAGAATYDAFIEEALEIAQRENPDVTREMLSDEVFNGALISAAAETATGIVLDSYAAKVAGLLGIGRKTAKEIMGVWGMSVRNVATSTISNIGEEATVAYIQDAAKEYAGMPFEGRGQAVYNALGPAAVAGAFGGIQNTAMSFMLNSTQKADIENTVRDAVSQAFVDDLSGDARTRFEDLVKSGKSPAEAHVLSLAADAVATRVASENGVDKASAMAGINAQDTDFANLVKTIQDADASLGQVADSGINFVWNRLTTEAQQAVQAFYGGRVSLEELSADLQRYIRNGDLPPGLPSIPGPEAATSVGNMVMDDFAPVREFEAMKNVLADSVQALEGNSKVRVSRDAADALGVFLDNNHLAVNPAIGRDPTKADSVLQKWQGEDLSDPAKFQQFIDEATPAMTFNFLNGEPPASIAGFYEQVSTALKPFTDLVEKNSGVRHDAETTANAQKMLDDGPVLKQFVDTLRGSTGSDAKVVQMETVLKVASRQVENLKNTVLATENPQLAKQARMYAEYVNQLDGIYRGVRTEQGRALRMGRKTLDDIDRHNLQKLREMKGAPKKADSDLAWWRAYDRIPDGDAKRGYVNETSMGMRVLDAVMQYGTSNMLTGPSTHVVNILGNASMVLNRVAVRGMAEYFLPSKPGGVFTGEFAASLNAFWPAVTELKSIFGDRSNLLLSENIRSTDAGRMKNAISAEQFGLSSEHGKISGGMATMVDLFGKITNLPFVALDASDAGFKHIVARMEQAALIVREAKGDHDLINKWSKKPPLDITKRAIKEAEIATFQNQLGPVGQMFNKARSYLPFLRWFVPFFKTPLNVAKTTARMTPGVHRLFKEMRTAMNSPNVATRQLAEAQLMLGTLLWGSAIISSVGGGFTGAGPDDWRDRQRKQATGWQPNSWVTSGEDENSYTDISRLDPLALIANGAATIVENIENLPDEDISTAGWTLLGQCLNIIKDRSYLGSTADMFEILNSPETGLHRAAKSAAARMVPYSSLGRSINRYDEFQREVAGVWEQARMAIPGGSQGLPIRRDYLGQPMKSSEYRGPRLLSPFRMSKDKQDLVYDELWRLRSGGFDVPAMPSKRLSAGDLAVTMDAREYSDFMGMYGTEIKIDGKTLMEALSNTIKSVEYQEWDDTKRGKNLKQLGTKYGSEARARAKAEFPRIRKSLRLQEEGIKSLINPIFQNQ